MTVSHEPDEAQRPSNETESTHFVRRTPEPIAVVGMGCRFAGGVDSPEDYWRLLMERRDGIGDVPQERWESYEEAGPQNAAALRKVTRSGGFLDDIAGFDADFFGILPREAELMDPQQRIVLEVAWEALEHAGIRPRSLAGGDAGVFIGVGSDDYGRRMLEDLPRIEAWTGIGAAFCAVANRVSYTLDLRGSSLAVDTACSASLVALHLACQALRSGECPVALAGGVNIMAGPGLTMVLDAAGAVSPDGRSKSFDASADGYGRGEGAGVVVLKRLSDAQRDGDRVLAVIRGSAVNQDGRTNGIMAPSEEAQAHLLRQAYRSCGIDPATVDYVEAHGTGTRAGDPIEVGAMAQVFGPRPADRPCLVGSVKPNIGHLEAGAGVAGLIKAVLALHHGEIPPQADYFTTPNPAIPWDEAGLKVVTEPTPWPATDHPRRAGVSGYGYGGTISHLILEEAPAPAARQQAGGGTSGTLLLPLSAATESGVRAQAGRLAEWLTGPGAGTPLADVASTLSVHRDHVQSRAVVVAADQEQAVERLTALAEQRPGDGVETGAVLPAVGDAVWVFSGHGAQWIGMGRELLDREPVFAAVLDEIGPVFLEEIGFSPRQVLVDGDLVEVDRIQPMIFAMQVALSAVWRSRGLRPSAVIGHSVGELAAAVEAGILSLLDGSRLICRRSALLRRVAGKGAMVMVNLPFDEVVERLTGRADISAAIAASPGSTVAAGGVDTVAAVAVGWEAQGLTVRRVASDVAFHSDHMDPLLDELRRAADDLRLNEPVIPVYSTALADPRSSAPRDGDYWAANLRNPVRFGSAVQAAAEDGHRAFLEVSAHPVVAHSIVETLGEAGIDDVVVAHTLRRNKPELDTLLANAAVLFSHGVPVDWSATVRGTLVDLPVRAWQHRPFWYGSAPAAQLGGGQHDPLSHTLLGRRVTVNGPTPSRLWQTYLDESCRPYPGDHPVQGVEIIPATVLLNTFFTAAADGAAFPGLTEVNLRVPVAVSTPREVQVVLQEGALRIASRIVGAEDADSDGAWLTHTTAVVSPATQVGARRLELGEIRSRCPEALPEEYVIDRLADIGVAAMGFPWQVREMRRGEGELAAVVSAAPDGSAPPSWASVLDAALSIASVTFPGSPILRMPAHMHEVALLGDCPAEVVLHARCVDGLAAADTVDVLIADSDGEVVARFGGLRYGVLDGDPGATASPRRLVSELSWQAGDWSADLGPLAEVVLLGDPEAAQLIGEGFARAGVAWRAAADPEQLGTVGPETAVLVVPDREHGPATAGVSASWLLTRTVQRLARQQPGERPIVRAVTRGVRESLRQEALGDSVLWGLGRVLAGEHPDLFAGVVDLSSRPTDEELAALVGLVREDAGRRSGEEVVSLRGAQREVPRLVAVEREPERAALECRADGTYLITGGLGVLGLEVATWLAGRGARRLVLAGRTALPPRSQWNTVPDPATRQRVDAVQMLEGLGVTVRTVAVDVADRAALAAALDPEALGLPPIRGVVHAAGVLDNRMALDVDEASLATVLQPKAAGALALHELFPVGALDFMVLFSSCGQLLGLPGQASYGSANAFLDALAWHRAALGDRTLSVAWTSWRGLGMSTSSELIDIELAARGTADISAAEAFRSWEFISRYDLPYAAAMRILPPEPGAERPRLLAELAVPDTDTLGQAETEWAALAPEELRGYLVDEVRAQVAGELKFDPDTFDVRRPLMEMGLDSVMTVVIRRRLEKIFRLSLPSTLLWDRPTVAAIGEFLFELLQAAGTEETQGQEPELVEPLVG
ncbi:type I polyketide synthase [Streptomyces camelliae]|uniref:Beta-ketoacyl synthase N-terminal-like domain-containing protein n=1 Tax=Streptomyces camelliae TaxID=3004093 RepID=A0ABY7P3A5_9ACTN|nr:type I polyketide synthase [Streptomyces sp. HUAS 2-6]WBO65004.1 beta-ketoacyl synthase N-terminal-like domain-containing protein [Streptomyces sp. HUAS 2-6]